jgi:hypothetical protein
MVFMHCLPLMERRADDCRRVVRLGLDTSTPSDRMEPILSEDCTLPCDAQKQNYASKSIIFRKKKKNDPE